MRKAEELSTTVAPGTHRDGRKALGRGAAGGEERDVDAVETRLGQLPHGRAPSRRNGSVLPAERAEANSRSSPAGSAAARDSGSVRHPPRRWLRRWRRRGGRRKYARTCYALLCLETQEAPSLPAGPLGLTVVAWCFSAHDPRGPILPGFLVESSCAFGAYMPVKLAEARVPAVKAPVARTPGLLRRPESRVAAPE